MPPVEQPGLTSRRVKRNRRLWVAGLLALALLAALLASRGGGHPSAAGQRHAGAGQHHDAAAARTPAIPASIRTGRATGRPVTFAFGGDVHFPAGTNLGDRLAADPGRRPRARRCPRSSRASTSPWSTWSPP